MATSTISNVISDPSGTAVAGVPVVARLKPPGAFRSSDSSEISATVSTTSDGSGSWTLALERNSNITPAGTWWEIEEQIPITNGGCQIWAVSVGSSNQTVNAARVTPSTDTTLASYLTQAAADARYLSISSTLALGKLRVTDYGAHGDGINDDTAAIQAAINALPAAGGTVFFPPGQYLVNSLLSIDDKRSIVLEGVGSQTGGATMASQLLFAASSGTALVSAKSDSGFLCRGLGFSNSAAGFTGVGFDCAHSGTGGDGYGVDFEHCAFNFLTTVTAAVSLDKDIGAHFSDTTFYGAKYGVRGGTNAGTYSNVVLFEMCLFKNQLVAGTANAVQSWNFNTCFFEPLSGGGNCAHTYEFGAAVTYGLAFTSCWWGDGNGTGNCIEWLGFGGLTIDDCEFLSGGIAVRAGAGSYGLAWEGGRVATATGLTTLGTYLRGTAIEGVDFSGCPTPIANKANMLHYYFSGNENLTNETDGGMNFVGIAHINSSGTIDMVSTANFTFTGAGTKFGTATTQKLGFYGATPVVQQSLAAAASDPATTQTLANSLRTALINLGLGA